MEQIKALFLLQPVIGILFKLLHFQQQTYFSTKWSHVRLSSSSCVPVLQCAKQTLLTMLNLQEKKSVNNQKQQIFTTF